MPINEYFKPAQFTPLDPNFLLRAKELNDQKAKKANDQFDALFADINKVKAVPQDTSLRNEKLKSYNEQLKLWTDKYADTPTQGLKDLVQIKRNFNQDFYYGQLGDIHKKGLQYEEKVKDYNERAGKGDFQGLEDVAYYNMVEAPLMQYQQSTEVKPGVYNSINWGQPGKYSDLGSDLEKFAQQWAANAGYGELKRDKYGYLSTAKNEYVDPREVHEGVMQYAYSNPKYRGQLEDMARYYKSQTDRYTNVTPEGIPFVEGSDESGNPVYMKPPTGSESVREYIGGMADAVASREGFQKLSKDYREDWMLKKAMEDKEKAIAPPVSYTAPSFVPPSKSYWDLKKESLSPSSSLGNAVKGATDASSYWKYGAGAPLLGAIAGFFTGDTEEGTLSKEAQVDLPAAEKLFGRAPTDYSGKVKLLEDYYDYMKDKHINIQPQLPGKIDPATNIVVTDKEAAVKEADVANLFYFGNEKNTKGTNIGVNLRWKEVGGDNKDITGQKLRKDNSDKTFNWAGRLPVDNPYFPAGDLYNAVDENNQITGTYAVEGTESNEYSYLWTMYQSKLYGSVPINLGGAQYTIEYQRGSGSTLDDQGRPIETGGAAILKDSQGKIQATSDAGSQDPIYNLYEKVRKKK